MGKNKLKQFAEIKAFPNVFEPEFEESMHGFSMKGNWNEKYFNNSNPIILEVGCGKGEYTTGLAQKYPDRNFIGLDLKGNRIWTGSCFAIENNLSNVGFVRARAETINSYFGKNEISEIWIPFPDPVPRKKGERKRLTCPRYLAKYQKFLIKGGIIHFKTDDKPLFDFTLEVIEKGKHKLHFSTDDLYGSDIICDAAEIRTYYEEIFLAKKMKICYLNFSLNSDIIEK
ncbi:MAG: tRNA (guanosine(46)-N7)-methyltransferase TrmB [Bacteroidota bacterium]